MDIGDLSKETYKAIIEEAERLNPNITLQFELMSDGCSNEDDFIDKSLKLIGIMKDFDNDDLDDLFIGNPPRKRYFHKALEKIVGNIDEVKKIPFRKRSFKKKRDDH